LPPLMPVPRDGELVLSFAQQRLWFLDQLEPESPFYNLAFAVGLLGSLDVAALEQGLREIVRRHEALRTIFPSIDGQPRQVVIDETAFELPVVDITSLSNEAAQSEMRRLAGEEAVHPFDLASGPLFRATLLRLSEQEHVLLLTMHHIVSDGWSMGI